MRIDASLRDRLAEKLAFLYGPRADEALDKLLRAIAQNMPQPEPAASSQTWSARDAVLISYGDQVRCKESKPLRCLHQFLVQRQLTRHINTLHLLPFFPYSSDDGFSVIDYRTVDPALGTWDDVHALRRDVRLMFDLVLNHVSSRSAWFQAYLDGRPPYTDYFIEVDPHTDLSAVVRPRSTPLLTPFETSRGVRYLWTTFSADQIDLNYANPDVLAEMVGILLNYIGHGARIIRLDAIAYLWKEIGTPCIHLPQTHMVVKLFRDVIDALAPGTLLLTETNVPHKENVSYFGHGDEAHLVYQFSLPPLLLDALRHHDATWLQRWLCQLEDTPPGTSFFNFTASHDGIGVRPLEGLVPAERIEQLVRSVRLLGGRVSMRRQADGSESPYELNITYFDALGDEGISLQMHVERFLASQAIMLSLRGIPGIYFHSLTASRNDLEGVRRTGHARSINRHKFDRRELDALLQASGAPHALVFDRYRQMLAIRIRQAAFHPEAEQTYLDSGSSALLALRRRSAEPAQTLTVVANVTAQPQTIEAASLGLSGDENDLLDSARPERSGFVLPPYRVAWFVPKP